jgi:hypothetical protein
VSAGAVNVEHYLRAVWLFSWLMCLIEDENRWRLLGPTHPFDPVRSLDSFEGWAYATAALYRKKAEW